ncbi:ABC transporter substrate-binding protein [Rhizobacter sp. SG703]|uniref:substrate-binding periplasmic protein n=1 Tax=Rhizobacter sp. SG703 TaxID=2587140 RepID=UPI0014453996|nr:ABC transporter substrate-binding protein [Rhizobacter sp. SG703]NKI94624.1 polar amino acid transport system substrate-binding protein [Rhizobacter sp. SG703]
MRFARCLAGLVLALTLVGAQAQAIRGVTEESGYTWLSAGRVLGPASEVVAATMQRAGFADYRVGIYPWARAYDMALQEPNVLIFMIARTPQREDKFKWAGEFMRIEYHLYKLRSSTEVVVRTLQDARAYSIGVVRDDVRQQYLQSQGFTRLVVSAQNGDNFRKLLHRQVQLVPMPERDARQLCDESHIDCAMLEKVYTLDTLSTGLFMAYSKATPDDVVLRTRAAFEKLKADGTLARLMAAPGR